MESRSIIPILIMVLLISNALANTIVILNENPNSYKNHYDYGKNNLNISIKKDWNDIINFGGEDLGRDVIVDDSDNIYTTGYIYNNSNGSYDIITRKYNSSGNLEWSKIWGFNYDDFGYGIYLDSALNVYVVGRTRGLFNESFDIILLKYDNNGILLYNKTWGYSGYDVGYDLVIDSQNYIYICGYSESFEENGDIILLKYNSSGFLIRNVSWGNTLINLGYAIACDTEGFIYITGYSEFSASEYPDLILLKFNKSCQLEWNRTWGGTNQEEGQDILITESDEIYVLGNTKSFSAGGYDVAIIEFNKTGDIINNFTWGRLKNDFGYSIAKNSQNFIYISGITYSFGDIDYGNFLIIKINSTGNELWNKTWGSSGTDIVYGSTVDNQNNYIITGSSNSDFYLEKFTPLPDSFSLNSDTPNPVPSGNFKLYWSKSYDADNYSIYKNNTFINKPLKNILLIKGLTNHSYRFSNLEEGIHYFLIVAYNEYGNTSSNCIKVIVQYPPGGFILSANAGNPDKDGNFTFSWTDSADADNYSIYMHSKFITEINNSLTLIDSGLLNNSYK
ncbi:MAG: SBBP repeat-containing protein [Promethearchaeota archaeon]